MGFFGRVAETTLVHLVAGVAAKVTEQGIDRAQEGLTWAKDKLETIKAKKTTSVPEPKKEEPSNRKTI